MAPDCAHCAAMQPVPGGQSTATMQKDMMSRMAAEDARLETLVADMNMFTGEMKIDAMARVLTLLAERNLMMRRHMMEMHGRMMSSMSEAMGAPPTAGAPNGEVTADSESQEMCLPPAN
jgi:hypothetical protein